MIDLNVCTLALPRLLVGRCLRSFLRCLEDRDQYRLHWICHLDQRDGQAEQYESTADQIRDLMPRFDGSTLVEPGYQRGFGAAALDVFTRAVYDVLWIPDDWLWTKPFTLTNVLKATDDCFLFSGAALQSISSPIFYRQHVIRYLLANFPENPDSLQGQSIILMLSPQFKIFCGVKPCRHLVKDR